MLLPYVDQKHVFNQIDFHVAWNHPDNAPHFQNDIDVYLSPNEFDREPVDGFAISHFAANSQILYDNRGLKFRDIIDGQSNVILLGEVGAGFRPWGEPTTSATPPQGSACRPRSSATAARRAASS